MSNDETLWSVSAVNECIRDLIENSFMPFWIQAEVGTLTIHRSGHVYLTLKDSNSQLRAAFFNGAELCRKLELAVGMEVAVFGKLTAYPPRGEYQFVIREMRPAGVGMWQKRFEAIRDKLAAEGLFEPERKRPLPKLPECVGVITSADGAALRDFLQIVDRRFPDLHIRIYPCLVQGPKAAESVAAGVEFFNRTGSADVLVITRGGGSMEDLWPFNEEVLARAVAKSVIPTISAVGHEIDFSICDFVADLRMPTPSAAAELVIGERGRFLENLRRAERDLKLLLFQAVEQAQRRLETMEKSYVLRRPVQLLEMRQQHLDELLARFEHLVASGIQQATQRLDVASGKLNVMNPRAVLSRGYALLKDQNNHYLSSASQTAVGHELRVELADGELEVTVKQVL